VPYPAQFKLERELEPVEEIGLEMQVVHLQIA
jgi:hypothetical protein